MISCCDSVPILHVDRHVYMEIQELAFLVSHVPSFHIDVCSHT